MNSVAAASELLKPFRRPADAVLSRKHRTQPRGERRRGMLEARGNCPDSGSSLCVDLPVLLRFQYLCFRLEPVIQGEAINGAALLVQLIGAVADAILDVG